MRVQNALGLRTRMLSPEGARNIVPQLDTDGLVAASFNPDDAVVFPWPFVWGYAEAANRLGVDVATFTRVTGFDTEGDRLTAVVTDKGRIRTRRVINATGAWSPELASMLGVSLPNHPHRHEICASEPLRVFLGPLVSDLGDGLYFSQSMRGELVGGVSNARVKPGARHGIVGRVPGALFTVAPAHVPVAVSGEDRASVGRLLRHHAGSQPDRGLDRRGAGLLPGVRLHGARLHDGAGDGSSHCGPHIATGREDPDIERWNLRRFREGRLLSEGMIIG